MRADFSFKTFRTVLVLLKSQFVERIGACLETCSIVVSRLGTSPGRQKKRCPENTYAGTFNMPTSYH